MTEGPERTHHTLSEILLDTRTTEEKVKDTAEAAADKVRDAVTRKP